MISISRSPVAAINRALAVAELRGPQEALRELDRIAADPRLAEYQPYWAARADFLARTGALDEAHHSYSVAIGLERDSSVRRFLEKKRDLMDEDSRVFRTRSSESDPSTSHS